MRLKHQVIPLVLQEATTGYTNRQRRTDGDRERTFSLLVARSKGVPKGVVDAETREHPQKNPCGRQAQKALRKHTLIILLYVIIVAQQSHFNAFLPPGGGGTTGAPPAHALPLSPSFPPFLPPKTNENARSPYTACQKKNLRIPLARVSFFLPPPLDGASNVCLIDQSPTFFHFGIVGMRWSMVLRTMTMYDMSTPPPVPQ